MGERGVTVRCPACNKFGSNKLGGYCKSCRPPEVVKDAEYYKNLPPDPPPMTRETCLKNEFFRKEPWFPETFGCLNKKNLNKEPTL